MITPRRTRLVRVPDLQTFRRAIAELWSSSLEAAGQPDAGRDDRVSPPHDSLPSRIIVVPTRAAAVELSRTLLASTTGAEATCLTRDELYDALHARLDGPPGRLTAFERDAMMQAAAFEAAGRVGDLPFSVRAGLVAEVLRFYDQLRRQSQTVQRFEELIADALAGDVDDRGAERLLRQTRFLATTFEGYEARAAASQRVDEHGLRERLMADVGAVPLPHVIVTVPDWIADPAGLFVADFDLLNRLPNLGAIDIVSTEGVLRSGFHERLHGWWPGLEELTAHDLPGASPPTRPQLICPQPTGDAAPLWFTRRDREEELIAVARRLLASPPSSLDRAAVVYKRPLPYLYLAAETYRPAGIPFTVSDTLPLAAEPAVAPLDLILDAVDADFAREPLIALLRSPHLDWNDGLERASIADFDRALSEMRFLGGADRLIGLAGDGEGRLDGDEDDGGRTWQSALDAAARAVRELVVFRQPRRASEHLDDLVGLLERHLTPLDDDRSPDDREGRARAVMSHVLRSLTAAHAAHHDPMWTLADLTTAVRRWIGEETFAPSSESSGLRLLDDQAARYAQFDDITVVGLIENEWPERTRRNIFYPASILRVLNWPSEKDRHAAAEARFLDLLVSPSHRIELSTFTLDDEAIVSRSIILDEVARARLSTVARSDSGEPLLPDETLALQRLPPGSMSRTAGTWLELRESRSPADAPMFHGSTGAGPTRVWSVSALETYIACPFKFFAQHVLRLEEEPDDEEVMDPRRQGQFVHEVFEAFFRAWQAAGHGEIGPGNLPAARDMFRDIVDRSLQRVSEGEAALERTRLMGSPAAAGLGEAVFRMEAERPVPVVARLLEHSLNGTFVMQTDAGPRRVSLRGKADRIDLLADGTFRLIDYKLGWPPDRGKALQLPIYGVCATQQLEARGRSWTLGEAVYLAFKGPRRVVPLFANDAARDDVLARAQQRLVDTIDAIERGEFPPHPDDVYRCESCSFSSVCRKDYVGDI